jgi:hypothetical protein
MATFFRPIATLALAIATFSTSVFADTYHDIDRLALSIERQTKSLTREAVRYRHIPYYGHLIADTREIARLADHLHEVAHHHGSLAHLESDLAELDSHFHHIEMVYEQIEELAARGHGHVHGSTCPVKRLLISIGNDIHRLQSLLQSLRTPVCPTEPVVVQRPAYYAPQPTWGNGGNAGYGAGFGGYHGYGHGFGNGNTQGYAPYRQPPVSRGITIGGGSSRFTIRF